MGEMLIYGQSKDTSPTTRGRSKEQEIKLSGCKLREGWRDNGITFFEIINTFTNHSELRISFSSVREAAKWKEALNKGIDFKKKQVLEKAKEEVKEEIKREVKKVDQDWLMEGSLDRKIPDVSNSMLQPGNENLLEPEEVP